MQKDKDKWPFIQPIMEKTNTLPNEMIHIMPEYAVHLHGHWNKMVHFMKPSILVNFSNGIKFYNCT
jgi:hypothetical protein